jgi:hypothetical protein
MELTLYGIYGIPYIYIIININISWPRDLIFSLRFLKMIAASVIASILLSSTVATKIFDEDFKTAALDSKIVDAINVTNYM